MSSSIGTGVVAIQYSEWDATIYIVFWGELFAMFLLLGITHQGEITGEIHTSSGDLRESATAESPNAVMTQMVTSFITTPSVNGRSFETKALAFTTLEGSVFAHQGNRVPSPEDSV